MTKWHISPKQKNVSNGKRNPLIFMLLHSTFKKEEEGAEVEDE